MKHRIETLCLPLFVPADRVDRIPKAIAAGPDAVLVDLEDAVSPAHKVAARDALSPVVPVAQKQLPILVRINAAGTEWYEGDLAAVASMRPDAVMLPKAESVESVRTVASRTGVPVVALVESATGLRNIFEIAQAASRVAFGSIDFAADLSMGHTRGALLNARSQIVLASRLAQIPAPLDGVTTAINDETIMMDDCFHAAELGFGGKLLIHPAQISPARRGFAPPDTEIAWAQRVIDASKSGAAAISIDGAMVDLPVIMRARQILRRAGRISG